MFDSECEDMDVDGEPTRYEKEEMIQSYISRFSKNILENEADIPQFVKNSRTYKQKKEEYILDYVNQLFECKGSKEVAITLSQLPEFVKSHNAIKKRFSQRDKMQLSEWRMLKNTNDVLKELQKNTSEVAYRQRVLIAAAALCPRYGDPGLSETRRVLEEAKSLKN